MTQQRFQVDSFEQGQSLLGFLASRLGCSRKKAKALLDARVVLVNSRRVWMARHALKHRDMVEVHQGPAPTVITSASLLYEDDDYIVLDKPSGILANGPESAEAALRNLTKIERLTAVHRLDRDTSGCLLLAKTTSAREAAEELFRARSIQKLYHAIVLGRVKADLKRVSRPLEDKTASTAIEVLDANQHASHLKLRLDTGRTHQIRKHLAGLRHPVLGDKVYATGKLAPPVWNSVSRQQLHAASLAFRHPHSGENVRVKAPLPGDFKACLKAMQLR